MLRVDVSTIDGVGVHEDSVPEARSCIVEFESD